jgi:restriction endonuclease S subunit
MPRASWEKMCDYDIKLPSIDEQKKLVRKLNAVETNIFSVLESIDATNE